MVTWGLAATVQTTQTLIFTHEWLGILVFDVLFPSPLSETQTYTNTHAHIPYKHTHTTSTDGGHHLGSVLMKRYEGLSALAQ